MYVFLRNLLFLFPPEAVHHFSMNIMAAACRINWLKKWLKRSFQPPVPKEALHFWGLPFSNAVGLGAGFDKNARYLEVLETLGFGFVETGTVTPLPQAGNEQPRLFRLPKDKALINRMGFNNDGVKVIANRLRNWKRQHPGSTLIIGGNIGKNKLTPNEEAWKDYESCFREMFDCVDYFVVNVSSPNTPGLRALQEKESLRKILGHLQTINKQQDAPKPLLLKIAPDLNESELDDIIDLAIALPLDGLVATNTTISREGLRTSAEKVAAIGAGGLSGLPVKNRAAEVVRYIHEKTKGSIPVIASGGIFTAADATARLQAGASLVQVWTGFIYEGPSIVKKICKGL
jgi:dihydroorotate dehydrogenase